MLYTDPIIAAPDFRAAIASAQRILLLTHHNPDGDAIGSLLGAAHVLHALGKTPLPVLSSAAPDYVQNLPGVAWLHVYTPGEHLPEADLTWMLDTANVERTGPIYAEQHAWLAERPLLVTDHHVTNDGGDGLFLVDATSASCADLLFRLLQAMAVPIPQEAATCLLLGTMTDTQSFQTSSTKALTLRTAADIIEAGGDLRSVVQAIYFALPVSTVRLTSLTLSAVQEDRGLFWAVVTQEMLRAADAPDGATDEAVGRMQRIQGMRACVLFRERRDGAVKLSLRSVPSINVAAIAQRWGGGGHAQAAGALLHMSLTDAQAEVLPLLRAAIDAENA